MVDLDGNCLMKLQHRYDAEEQLEKDAKMMRNRHGHQAMIDTRIPLRRDSVFVSAEMV